MVLSLLCDTRSRYSSLTVVVVAHIHSSFLVVGTYRRFSWQRAGVAAYLLLFLVDSDKEKEWRFLPLTSSCSVACAANGALAGCLTTTSPTLGSTLQVVNVGPICYGSHCHGCHFAHCGVCCNDVPGGGA